MALFFTPNRSGGGAGMVSTVVGPKGDAATIEVGTVTTVAAGSDATVTNVGTTSAAVLDFEIPSGAAATISVGTVDAVAAGNPPTVTNSGTTSAAVFDFEIPGGAAATVAVGTVSTVPFGDSATVTNSGTATAAVLDFEIPAGEPGEMSGPGNSVDGEIALFNGTSGTELKRASTTGLLKASSGVLAQAVAGTDYYNPGGTDVAITDGGTGASTAQAAFDALKQAATDSATGVVELAIASEVNTGTDTARAITPDALAGSNYGTAVVPILVFDDSQNVATGDGAGDVFWRVPSVLNGWNLVAVAAQVQTAGTTNTTDIQIHNVTQAADMLSTKITIDSGETDSKDADAAAVIDTNNDDVATGDQIRIDVDAVSSTPPKGLLVELQFRLP